MTDEVRELQFRYAGSYIGRRLKNGEVQCINVQGIRSEREKDDSTVIKVYGNLPNGKDVSFTYDPKTFISIPQLGFVNHRGCAIYIALNTARQYRKGITRERLSCTNISNMEAQVLRRKIATNFAKRVIYWTHDGEFRSMNSPEFQEDVWNRKYYSFSDAINLVMRDPHVLSVAIDYDLAIAIPNAEKIEDKLVLYYKTNPIGLFTDTKSIMLYSKSFSFLTNYLSRFFTEIIYEN